MFGICWATRGLSTEGGIPGWRIRSSPVAMLRFALSSDWSARSRRKLRSEV
jgi:hypothetical protein